MAKYFKGRYTAQHDEAVVVFIIGMRVNRLLSVKNWLATSRAMGKMLQTLYKYPEKGFKGGQTIFYWRGIGLIQYWDSFESLEKFAREPSEPHLEAWKEFNRSAGKDGSVGVWHETYQVQPGKFEAIYSNMPEFGLAAATRHISVTAKRESARNRMEKSEG